MANRIQSIHGTNWTEIGFCKPALEHLQHSIFTLRCFVELVFGSQFRTACIFLESLRYWVHYEGQLSVGGKACGVLNVL